MTQFICAHEKDVVGFIAVVGICRGSYGIPTNWSVKRVRQTTVKVWGRRNVMRVKAFESRGGDEANAQETESRYCNW